MIKEAQELPMADRDALMAEAGYKVAAKMLMARENLNVETASTLVEILLNAEMRRMLQDGWKNDHGT